MNNLFIHNQQLLLKINFKKYQDKSWIKEIIKNLLIINSWEIKVKERLVKLAWGQEQAIVQIINSLFSKQLVVMEIYQLCLDLKVEIEIINKEILKKCQNQAITITIIIINNLI